MEHLSVWIIVEYRLVTYRNDDIIVGVVEHLSVWIIVEYRLVTYRDDDIILGKWSISLCGSLWSIVL